MKYTFTVEVDTDTFDTDDIIGAKEQVAMALEGIGKVTFTNVERGDNDGECVSR